MTLNAPMVWMNYNKRRYYTVSIEKDLFDDVVVVRSWGGTDTRRGGMEREVVASQEDGARLLEAISRRRAMRGYRRVN